MSVNNGKTVSTKVAKDPPSNDSLDIITLLEEFTEEAYVLFAPIDHEKIFAELLENAAAINFFDKAFPGYEKMQEELDSLEKQEQPYTDDVRKKIKGLTDKLDKIKLQQKHFVVIAIEETMALASRNKWAICINNGFVYLFNNAFWKPIDKEGLQKLFGEIAEKLGVPKFDAKHYQFREALLKQFFAVAHLPRPKRSRDNILMNFLNGTLQIDLKNKHLRKPSPNDFLTYQLPFEYNPDATAPQWSSFLDRVLPDQTRQDVLGEYLASAFVGNTTLKLEKVLMLYGTGSNGKGVVYEVITALFGRENVSNYSLESLTDETGYYRAKIINTLINYSSENGTKVDANFFKQLASGEAVPARLPYGEPFQITDYAKLIFNTNRLPREGVEQTYAFFRRFLIIHFDVTIAEGEADKELHLKIIKNELPGVFNWVMNGLDRLLRQKGFTHCEDAIKQVEEYQTQSDSVRSFLVDEQWEKSNDKGPQMSEFYLKYQQYCGQNGLKYVAMKEYSIRLKGAGYELKRMNTGMYAMVKQVAAI